MLRFLPDSWLEGLLRPFLMADPSAGLYYEEAAPDWRFLLLAVLLAIALLAGRFKGQASHEHRRMLLTLCALFYTWTFTIGNGRYFIAGLLMVGPLVVLTLHWLPGTRTFRWLLLALILVFQAGTVASMYRPGAWNMLAWKQGPAVYVSKSPTRETPAVFVTLTSISYSILVPSFHPESRWVNLKGQVDITPKLPEYARARQLLKSTLPMYLVAPASQSIGEPDLQPSSTMWRVIAQALDEHGLEPSEQICESVRTNLLPHGVSRDGKPIPPGAFWICPVRLATAPPKPGKIPANAMDDVFERVEAYCPRFFPPGGSETKRYEDHWLRYYLGTDTRVFVEDTGIVTYKYFRHFTPVVVGSVEDVRQGRFEFNCGKLQGRYEPPWSSW